MLRGDIRYEQGCADEKPSNIAAGEEVFFRTALLQGEIQADAEDDGEIHPNDYDVECCEGSVSHFDRSYEQHQCLLGAAAVEPAPAYCPKRPLTACANCHASPCQNDGASL